MPIISIVVPNFNHSKYLRKTIDCILNQTYTDYDVILLDDYVGNVSHKICAREISGSHFKTWK